MQAYMVEMYGTSIDLYTCTPVCPCDIAHKEKFRSAVKSPGFKTGKSLSRVESMNDLTPAEREQLVLNEDPLVWDLMNKDKKITKYPLYWVNKNVKSYSSFKECWDDPKKIKKFMND